MIELALQNPAVVPCLVACGIVTAIAIALLIGARRADARNWIYARAPQLPIRLLTARDDAWVRGVVECAAPITVPRFGARCVYFEFLVEEKRTRTVRTSKGGTRTETYWAVVQRDVQGVPFDLVEGDHRLRIDPTGADLHDLESSGYDHEWSRRYSAAYVPLADERSALGCVTEDGHGLEAHANIPLLLCRRTRDAFLRGAETGERWLRRFGFALLFLGVLAGAYGGWMHVQGSYLDPVFVPKFAVVATTIAALVTLGTWVMHAYNTLIAYRTRTLAAWRHIDVDLKQRFDLVPRLATIVAATAAHERTTFEELSRLRTAAQDARAAIRAETSIRGSVAQVLALAEKYPELRASTAYAKLHDQLVALEDKIAHDRTFFDDCATEFNTTIATFPRSLLARAFGFTPWPLFEATRNEARAPAVA